MTDSGPRPLPGEARWLGLPIVLSNHAITSASDLCMGVDDVTLVLEHGEDCQHSPRRQGTRERCAQWGHQRIKVVALRTVSGWYPGTDVWLIKTIGPAGDS